MWCPELTAPAEGEEWLHGCSTVLRNRVGAPELGVCCGGSSVCRVCSSGSRKVPTEVWAVVWVLPDCENPQQTDLCSGAQKTPGVLNTHRSISHRCHFLPGEGFV